MNGESDWLVTRDRKQNGCTVRSIADANLYPIITDNRYNQKKKTYACPDCRTYNQLDGSYISLVDESVFIAAPDQYIENAWARPRTNEVCFTEAKAGIGWRANQDATHCAEIHAVSSFMLGTPARQPEAYAARRSRHVTTRAVPLGNATLVGRSMTPLN